MVGLPYDCLSNPLGAVRVTFEKAVAGSPDFDPATFDRKDWGAVDVFRSFLFNDGGLSQVLVLEQSNLHLIRPNSLVRFRGMVQDMLGNELYIGAFKDGSTWRTNKFTDVAPVPISPASQTRLWERRLLYCVPVPGQNTWVSEVCPSTQFPTNLSNDHSLNYGEKRRREDNANMDFDKEGELSSLSPLEMVTRDVAFNSRISPLDAGSLSCLVKIYDMPENDIKLNDVIEFIGVYTFDPDVAVHDSNDADEFPYGLMEDISVHLPPSKVPRLHCLTFQKMSPQDLVSRSCFIEGLPSAVRVVRESLLRHLTAVLGNDGLAAQFILLHLLSRVRARVDVVVVGKLSVNLTGFTRETIPLSVEYLNTTQLQPRKDNSTGRMIAGILQLAQGTHLTVDETRLDAGTLNAAGVENARLLRQLLEWQTVGYDCEYYKLDLASDVQVLVLSDRKSNVLPADVVLPFHPVEARSTVEAPGEEELRAWRWYLAAMRSLPLSIGSQMQKVIEDDFVASRQEDKTLKGEDLSRWVTMGQLMSASFGETQLSLEHWQMVKEMERLRRERLS
ncbi:unnamed protein product [Spirodela intermedia]|uniref:Uncharacterized protein n=1 Tax=Spirodela intermedia TaxID=51605 RepID=A0A7I8IGD9_SPIIN|nr:unnamed protein product [Spirodela intermedia]CAA6656949.1 unnamed protein product [Spirodela intermedia]